MIRLAFDHGTPELQAKRLAQVNGSNNNPALAPAIAGVLLATLGSTAASTPQPSGSARRGSGCSACRLLVAAMLPGQPRSGPR